MPISLRIDTHEIEKTLDDLQKSQVRFSLSRAINATMFGAQDFLKDTIDNYVEGGATPWTKRGIWVKKSTKKQLYSAVYIEDKREYLSLLAFGGTRTPLRGMNYLIGPVSQKLNKYGNIPRNTIKKKASNTKLYFYGKPKGRNNRPHGLYKRFKRKPPELIIRTNIKSMEYEAQWPANKIALAYFKRHFKRTYNKAFNQAMKTARPLPGPVGF